MLKPLAELQMTDFTAQLHTPFQIYFEGRAPIDLELVEVTELRGAGAPPAGSLPPAGFLPPTARAPFSLTFLGPVSPYYLKQHIYALEHAQLGVLELFLVPLGPDPDPQSAGRMRYEAIFS